MIMRILLPEGYLKIIEQPYESNQKEDRTLIRAKKLDGWFICKNKIPNITTTNILSA